MAGPDLFTGLFTPVPQEPVTQAPGVDSRSGKRTQNAAVDDAGVGFQALVSRLVDETDEERPFDESGLNPTSAAPPISVSEAEQTFPVGLAPSAVAGDPLVHTSVYTGGAAGIATPFQPVGRQRPLDSSDRSAPPAAQVVSVGVRGSERFGTEVARTVLGSTQDPRWDPVPSTVSSRTMALRSVDGLSDSLHSTDGLTQPTPDNPLSEARRGGVSPQTLMADGARSARTDAVASNRTVAVQTEALAEALGDEHTLAGQRPNVSDRRSDLRVSPVSATAAEAAQAPKLQPSRAQSPQTMVGSAFHASERRPLQVSRQPSDAGSVNPLDINVPVVTAPDLGVSRGASVDQADETKRQLEQTMPPEVRLREQTLSAPHRWLAAPVDSGSEHGLTSFSEPWEPNERVRRDAALTALGASLAAHASPSSRRVNDLMVSGARSWDAQPKPLRALEFANSPVENGRVSELFASESAALRVVDVGARESAASGTFTAHSWEQGASLSSPSSSLSPLPSLGPASPAAKPSVAPPVNLLQAETAADGLAKQIETINVSGLHRLRVALHPSTLGELELTIQRSLEGDVSVQITAQQQTAREVLELHLPKIRTLLEEQQGRFVDVSVSQDNGGTQSQSQGRDQAPTDAPDHALNKRSPDLDGQGSGIFRQPSDSRHDGLVEAYV